MAAGTSFSGSVRGDQRHRIPPPTSIITTSGVPVAGRRYSVWPERQRPASQMMPLCTGAVTIPANSPDVQPAMSPVGNVEHVAAVGGVSLAGHGRHGAAGTCRHLENADAGSASAAAIDDRDQQTGQALPPARRASPSLRAPPSAGQPAGRQSNA